MPVEIINGKAEIVGCYWQDSNFHNFLPPPNADEVDLGSLKYGRMDYDWLLLPPTHTPSNERYYEQSDKGNWWLRANWRELLERPDPYAKLPLHTDPTTGAIIWQPVELQELLSASAEVVSWILKIMDQRSDSKLRLKFQSCLQRVFLVEYASNAARCQDAKTSVRWFNHGVDRIAGCLLNNFQVYPELWFESLLKCEQLKANYQHLTGVLRPKIKFKKREERHEPRA